MPSTLQTTLRYLRLAIVAFLLALIIKALFIEAYSIPSESMANTLLIGDFLLADKFSYGPRIPFTDIRLPAIRSPKVGDVVVFRFVENPGKSFIKRIVAKGGDEVQILDKVLYINGKVVDESHYAIHTDSIIIPFGTNQARDNFGPVQVPFGQFFLLGDNRDNSSDSRFWGTVPRDNIIGRAIMVHWSMTPDGNAPNLTWWNPLSILRVAGYQLYHLPDHVRWGRLFSSIE